MYYGSILHEECSSNNLNNTNMSDELDLKLNEQLSRVAQTALGNSVIFDRLSIRELWAIHIEITEKEEEISSSGEKIQRIEGRIIEIMQQKLEAHDSSDDLIKLSFPELLEMICDFPEIKQGANRTQRDLLNNLFSRAKDAVETTSQAIDLLLEAREADMQEDFIVQCLQLAVDNASTTKDQLLLKRYDIQ